MNTFRIGTVGTVHVTFESHPDDSWGVGIHAPLDCNNCIVDLKPAELIVLRSLLLAAQRIGQAHERDLERARRAQKRERL